MANEYNNKVVLADGTVLIDLTADTAVANKVLSGYTFHNQAGKPETGTCTFDSDTTNDTALVGEILETKTAHARGVQLTGTMPNNGGVTGTITTKAGAYVVPQGYHDGSGSVSIDSTEQSKIIANNIKSGVTILGVLGTYSGESITAETKSVTPKLTSQTILPSTGYDYIAQVNLAAITITYSDNSAGGKTVTIGAV